jgi:hypothetical protein
MYLLRLHVIVLVKVVVVGLGRMVFVQSAVAAGTEKVVVALAVLVTTCVEVEVTVV